MERWKTIARKMKGPLCEMGHKIFPIGPPERGCRVSAAAME